jgi:transmembrane sensor
VVEVSLRNMPETLRVRAGAGTKAEVAKGAPIATRSVSTTQLARDLAWQHGQLEFNNETLASAAEEFARYSGTTISVDPTVADRTITGSFAAKDPVGFARAAAAVLDLRLAVHENEVRIFR